MRVPLAIAVVVASLALMAHVVPGFSNLLIVKDAIVSRDGAPFTLYFNFDKALIGLFLLAFGTPLAASRAEWFGDAADARFRAPSCVIAAVLVAAFALGHVRFEPKWPAFFPLWAWANLLFTVTAEEAVFRGVIQRTITGDASIRSDSTRRSAASCVAADALRRRPLRGRSARDRDGDDRRRGLWVDLLAERQSHRSVNPRRTSC